MGLKRIPLDQIIPNPDQPRPPEEFDEQSLNELADTIDAEGLRQAITVCPAYLQGDGWVTEDADGNKRWFKYQGGATELGYCYVIACGERRWRAHRILRERGSERVADGTILANVNRMDKQQIAITAILENMARKDLSPLAEARQWKAALDAGFELADLARRSGVAQWRIKYRLQLLNLDPTIQGMLAAKQISCPMAHEVGRLGNTTEQIKVVKLISGGQLTSDKQVSAAVNTLLNPEKQDEMFSDLPPAATPKELATVSEMEARIERVLTAVAGGWKDGECVIAKRVSPDRAAVVAEKLAALRLSLTKMEAELRAAAVTGMLALQAAE
jgi:ParB family chromosome partitioning protein